MRSGRLPLTYSIHMHRSLISHLISTHISFIFDLFHTHAYIIDDWLSSTHTFITYGWLFPYPYIYHLSLPCFKHMHILFILHLFHTYAYIIHASLVSYICIYHLCLTCHPLTHTLYWVLFTSVAFSDFSLSPFQRENVTETNICFT